MKGVAGFAPFGAGLGLLPFRDNCLNGAAKAKETKPIRMTIVNDEEGVDLTLASPVFFGHGVFDPITGSGSSIGGFGAVDGAGNSFTRVDQDTRIQGQNIIGLTDNRVSNQQSGPGIAADNTAAVVVTNEK
ncbi:hypothetical protein IW140_006240 [Coemansia sp. RSA 1813]|nr:hypothetical protein IW140_006240 [Coemansia sp. RSA 1813]